MGNNLDKIAKPPESERAGNKTNQGVNEKDKPVLKKSARMAEDLALTDEGSARKRIRKEKLFTLNPECVRSLLENRIRMILSQEATDPKFLKHLFVSKRFFNIAQRYPIFCLCVAYRSKKTYLGFTDLSIFKLQTVEDLKYLKDLKGSTEIVLSYEKFDSLLLMLKPNHIFMGFPESAVSNETITKAIGHLKLIPGKVGLTVIGDVQAEFSLLLNQFSRRKLEYLQCSPDFLTRSDVILKLGHYGSPIPINNGQLRKVLSHELDYLVCEIDEHFMDEPAPPQSLSSDHCTSLKLLYVDCNQHYDSLMAFLDVVKEKCTNLQTIGIKDVILEDDGKIPNVSNVDEILDQILFAQGHIQKIIEKCRQLVPRLKIFSTVPMLYNSEDEFSCDWIQRAKSLEWLEDSVHEETIKLLDGTIFKMCVLDGNFDDGFLNLYTSISVLRTIPEELSDAIQLFQNLMQNL